MALSPCSLCARHVRDIELTCPFCGSTAERYASKRPARTARRVSAAAALLAGAISVAGCYGGAPSDYGEEEPAVTSGEESEGAAATEGEAEPGDETAPE